MVLPAGVGALDVSGLKSRASRVFSARREASGDSDEEVCTVIIMEKWSGRWNGLEMCHRF